MEAIPEPTPNFDLEQPSPAESFAPCKDYDIGNHTPVELITFIDSIEYVAGIEAEESLMPGQTGDVIATCADIAKLTRDEVLQPATPLSEGIACRVKWYRSSHRS